MRRFRFLIPLFFIAVFLVLSWVVQTLWNNVLVDTVSVVKAVSYPQAMGLLVLFRILFGGFRLGRRGGQCPPKGGPPHWREKWKSMNNEDREKLRNEWKKRFGGKE